jgi:hypothetical protein
METPLLSSSVLSHFFLIIKNFKLTKKKEKKKRKKGVATVLTPKSTQKDPLNSETLRESFCWYSFRYDVKRVLHAFTIVLTLIYKLAYERKVCLMNKITSLCLYLRV